MLARRRHESGQQTALWRPRGDGFESVTWNSLVDEVCQLAAALEDLGLRPGDRAVLVSENRYEWVLFDLAVHVARGAHVAVHASLTGPQIAYQITDCGATIVVVSTREQAIKLAEVAESLSTNPIFLTLESQTVDLASLRFQPLMERARLASLDRGKALFELAVAETSPRDLATILYTSGTTGEPKGVMLSHGNLATNALASCAALGYRRRDLRLCWLPLSHIYARTCDLYCWIAEESELALAESRETVLRDCQRIRPTYLNGVPYFYDKVMQHVIATGSADSPDALIELLGGRLELCCAGGAALPRHVTEFFQNRGVTLVQGYGLTESSPVITAGSSTANRIGTVGPPISGVDVRIADDGEVLTRGPHVMLGYWNRPDATAEAICDGWLRTGDLGSLDRDGFLTITGRKKELIVTAAGKNIAPTMIEALLCEDALIAQAIVIGDDRNYLVALLAPNRDQLRAEIVSRRLPISSAAEALAHDAVRSLFSERIAARLAQVAPHEQVRKFTLIGRAFSIESGELTPTLKMRRKVIEQNFAAEIAAMYGS